jgi:hypothetical protein
MPSLIDHVHTYIRWKKFGEEYTFKCAHPDCSETRNQSYLWGKRGICAICGINEIIYTPDDLRRVKPRCADCSNAKIHRQRRKIKEKLASLLDFESTDQENQPDEII